LPTEKEDSGEFAFNMETKQQILNKTEALFFRYGLKSVTMDDIARELGISKKTLYQFVENKQDLIEQIFQNRIEEEKTIMREIREEAEDAIEEVLKIAIYVTTMLRAMTPTIMYDLEKYYKKTWLQMQQLHQKHIYQIIFDNLNWGIDNQLYRADFNPEIIAKIYVAKSSDVADPERFPHAQYDMETLFREFFLYHMHGVVAPQGLELLHKHMETFQLIKN